MFKKILAYALTVCLLVSAMVVPAYAVDDGSPAIYYTDGYYPGLISELRSAMTFANPIAHGSFAKYNYNPSYFYGSGSVVMGDFADVVPNVFADQSDVTAIYSIPNTVLLRGESLVFRMPSTRDAYFDFQSSNILFDQQDANANTFYLNGTLTFSLRNLWSFDSSVVDSSWYLASDPLAIQLLIDGKAYGDIIDISDYTSPFTALCANTAIPANASVTFDNLKVYYQGDTPEFIGFRIYTGSAYPDSQFVYGDFNGLAVQNSITMRFVELPDITFVNEGGDGYAGNLSGISGLLSDIKGYLYASGGSDYLNASGIVATLKNYHPITGIVRMGFLGLRSILSDGFTNLSNVFRDADGNNWFSVLNTNLSDIRRFMIAEVGETYLGSDGSVGTLNYPRNLMTIMRIGLQGLNARLVDAFYAQTGDPYLNADGSTTTLNYPRSITVMLRQGLMGLASKADTLTNMLVAQPDETYLNANGNVATLSYPRSITVMLRQGLMGLATLEKNAQSYVADTVFKWQSYNMDTHELNTATNVTGQNNLFFTAFQSMEDKLGRLAYVFGSDEDLALKDAADPGTDAFRENFGGGASLSDIKDSAELVTSVPQLMDSGFDFADGIEEIGSNDGYLAWFSSDTWAALDSTGAAVAADSDYLSDYYDNLRKVDEKRHWGD